MKTCFLLLLSSSFAVGLRENSREESFPWRVDISFAGFHFCAGALISDTLVLTAATCLAIFDEGTSLDIELGDGQKATSNEMIVQQHQPVCRPWYHSPAKTFSGRFLLACVPIFTYHHLCSYFISGSYDLSFPISLPSQPLQVVPLALPLPGESLEEGDSICFQEDALLCLQVVSPTHCISVDGSFPDGVICVERLQGDLCSAGTPGNAGVVGQDIVGHTTVRLCLV